MKKHAAYLLLVLGCVTFLAGGCSRKEMVKSGEPLAPDATVASVAKTETSKTETPTAETVSGRPVAQAAHQESAVMDALKSIDDAGDLAAALEKVYFDFDRHTLSPAARDTLVKNARLLQTGIEGKVRIAGHCDERGSDDYNLALSERRAKAAMQYLVSLGIPAERLSVIGFGKEKPAAVGHDEASWAENRRGEFEVTPQ